MKQTKRRLLSLLMAFAILCTMIPAAFAAESDIRWSTPTCTEGHSSHTPKEAGRTEATCAAEGKIEYTCEICGATGVETIPKVAHTWSEDWSKSDTKHWHECSVCHEKKDEADHNVTNWTWSDENHTGTCSVCNQPVTQKHTYTSWTSDGADTHSRYCSVCDPKGTNKEQEKHDFTDYSKYIVTATGHTPVCKDCGYKGEEVEHKYVDGKCVCGAVSPSKGTLTVSPSPSTSGTVEISYGKSRTFSVTPKVMAGSADVTSVCDITYQWLLDKEVQKGETKSSYSLSKNLAPGRYYLTCTVTASYNDGTPIGEPVNMYWTVDVKADVSATATVYSTTSGYSLGDKDDNGDTSVADQIWDAVDKFTDGRARLDYVKFSSVTDSKKGSLDAKTSNKYGYDDLTDVIFTPYDEEYTGTATFDFTAYDNKSGEYPGTLTITVKKGTASGGDIIYTATTDDDVTLDVKDFEEFWEDEYSKGTLDYVTFGSVSSRQGSLVDGDGKDLKTSTKCYADPSSKQIDLDEVTFEPKKGYTGAVTIDFTATGTTSSSSKSTKDLKGTLVILYTKNEPKAITYSVTDKPVTLDGDDFLANYKDTMGTSAKTLQIKFLDVPSNGTLYYNYNEKTEKGTELTSKNIGSYTFSTSSRASKALADVTYVPDSKGRSDTVKFACYDSSDKLCYYGEVTFGVTVKEVTVSLSSTSAGVTFNSADFFGASEDMLAVTYLTFGTPSNGTLYKNWTGITGTRVSSTDKFSYVASVTGYTSIGSVTYVPTAGYSGTVTIPFSAYTASGTVINGTVSIKVTATSTVIFTDVPTTGPQSWAYPYINRLASAGVVGGVTGTTYGPKQQVKWGEALKMVLLGAGHPAQTEGTGSNWAANYLTYAYQKGIVNSNKIDLSKPITRVEMAELAAKALGLSPETSIKTGIIGPTDTTNGYVYALYNRGIVGGDSSSGKNLYNPNSTLLRDEMAKIVCGVMDNAK